MFARIIALAVFVACTGSALAASPNSDGVCHDTSCSPAAEGTPQFKPKPLPFKPKPLPFKPKPLPYTPKPWQPER